MKNKKILTITLFSLMLTNTVSAENKRIKIKSNKTSVLEIKTTHQDRESSNKDGEYTTDSSSVVETINAYHLPLSFNGVQVRNNPYKRNIKKGEVISYEIDFQRDRPQVHLSSRPYALLLYPEVKQYMTPSQTSNIQAIRNAIVNYGHGSPEYIQAVNRTAMHWFYKPERLTKVISTTKGDLNNPIPYQCMISLGIIIGENRMTNPVTDCRYLHGQKLYLNVKLEHCDYDEREVKRGQFTGVENLDQTEVDCKADVQVVRDEFYL